MSLLQLTLLPGPRLDWADLEVQQDRTDGPGPLISGRCLARNGLYKQVKEAMADPSEQQRKYKEFLDLMPLTIALAGLPESEVGRYFTAEQIESRVFTLKHAYKCARQLARETISGS